MNKIKSYFMFSREHRSGILLLFFLIFSAQIIYFFVSDNLFKSKEIKEDKAWLLVQNEIDSLNKSFPQRKIRFIHLIQILLQIIKAIN